VGFEVTPATVIAVLTILGFSLYDTVVVFDKVRENTAGLAIAGKKTYTQAANDAVNQTLMRSINTSLIALLPVASLLFIGAGLLGAGTLKDLALAQLVGLASGAYSSIFIATPLLVDFKEREPGMKALAARVARSQAAEVAREARSERTARPVAAAGETAVVDAEAAAPDDAVKVTTPVRAGVGAGPPRRPAKRSKGGRPSGKKRR
jgi:preprotein translocase subunit SecF